MNTKKFITLYLPNDALIRTAFAKHNKALSVILINLIFDDMHQRTLISDEEYETFKNFKKLRFHKRGDQRKDSHKSNNYSFYIAQELIWIIERIDSNLLKKDASGAIEFKSRSKYIWYLFSHKFIPNQKDSVYAKAG